MAAIPTVKVHRLDLPDLPMELNVTEFDPGIHTKWGEKKVEPPKVEPKVEPKK
jgi:hypothetical protein